MFPYRFNLFLSIHDQKELAPFYQTRTDSRTRRELDMQKAQDGKAV